MVRFAVVPKGWTTSRTARDCGREGGEKRPERRGAECKPAGAGRIKDSCKPLLAGNVLLTGPGQGGGKESFGGGADFGSPLRRNDFRYI